MSLFSLKIHYETIFFGRTQTVGGSLATTLAVGSEPIGARRSRSDCMTCPALTENSYINSFVTGRQYSIRDIEPSQIHCKLQNYRR